jgi:hypothetical protein
MGSGACAGAGVIIGPHPVKLNCAEPLNFEVAEVHDFH